MKVLNIVLSILILVLAIASAFFSYLLFEKRTQMVDGYEKLGNQIVNTAKALDVNSGTTVGKALSGDVLDHKSTGIDSALSKLTKLAKDVGRERDALAQTLSDINTTAGGKSITKENLTNLSSYQSAADAVKAQVTALNQNRNALVSALQSSADVFSISLSMDKLRAHGTELNNELKRFSSELANVKRYKLEQEKTMKSIAAKLGVSGLSFTPVRYRDDLDKYNTAINNLFSENTSLKADKNSLTSKLNEANNNIVAMDKEIAEMKKLIAQKDRDFKALTASINGERYSDEIAIWQPGSEDARKATQGTVIAVNEKFGFITIDIGSNYRVEQLISSGSAPIAVDPQIAVDDVMIVSPTLDTSDAQSSGKLRVIKVEGNCAFADIVENTDREIEVGDVVIFDVDAENN